MIKVIVKEDIITVSGHANYADYGKDIVCAAASSIVTTTINSILKLEPDSISYTTFKDVEIKILKHLNVTDVLLSNMLDLLKELEKQYPKHIEIRRC